MISNASSLYHEGLGAAYLAMKDADKAIVEFEVAIEINIRIQKGGWVATLFHVGAHGIVSV